jgi:hypothetical protein
MPRQAREKELPIPPADLLGNAASLSYVFSTTPGIGRSVTYYRSVNRDVAALWGKIFD